MTDTSITTILTDLKADQAAMETLGELLATADFLNFHNQRKQGLKHLLALLAKNSGSHLAALRTALNVQKCSISGGITDLTIEDISEETEAADTWLAEIEEQAGPTMPVKTLETFIAEAPESVRSLPEWYYYRGVKDTHEVYALGGPNHV